jgi:SAM-dependent methyltransferase
MKKDLTRQTIGIYNAIASSYAAQAEGAIPTNERDAFVSSLPPKASVLDAGCGSGRDCRFFVEKGYKVTGVDLSEKLLAIARSNVLGATFIKADLRHLPFAHGSFDGVWACASIFHIPKEETLDVLVSFRNILKPGGSVMLIVKEGEGEKLKEEPSTPGIKRYYSFFTREEFTGLVEKSGFEVVTSEVYNENEVYKRGRSIRWITCLAKKS